MISSCRPYKSDTLLHRINSNFVSLRDQDIQRNNKILHKVLTEVIEKLKQKSELFRYYFRNIKFVGSFYKGTKVGKPEEFDLNVVFELPLKYEFIQFEHDLPGFVKLKVNRQCYKPDWEHHKQFLEKIVTSDGYLNQEEFRRCMESTISCIPETVSVDNKTYTLKLQKSGPAFTLKLFVKDQEALEMCVDMVPVLEFTQHPPGIDNEESWYAIPKTGKNLTRPQIHWRMSFYSREGATLKKYQHLKDVVRLLKKLRDTADWKVLASYHIETLVLHSVRIIDRNPELQRNSLTEHFVRMLGELKKACETKQIFNFWVESHNLLGNLEPGQLKQLESIKLRLETMIKEIEKNPTAIADYMLSEEERKAL